MFAWGSTVHGELGLGGIEDEHILGPRYIEWSSTNRIKETACGATHSLLLTVDGKVYSCGNNDFGQLGHTQPRKRPHLVPGLEAHEIVHVSCGASHSMALNKWGQVYAWGSDHNGQLGLQVENYIQPVPKILRALASYHVIQIICGERHSIALTNKGEIYGWGSNIHGQLGIGKNTQKEVNPVLISTLFGIPISIIACGGHHSFALSKSGAVYGWGKNNYGQLGLNDTTSRPFPNQLRSLRNIKVKYIACGEEFSTFLTADGGVFTCGAGMYGQLGHGTTCKEMLPKQIIELMGSTITQIACGRQHTLGFVPSRGRIYSFGLGGAGQLGFRKTTNATTPQLVIGPFNANNHSNSHDKYWIRRIFAGGDHCFAIVSKVNNDSPYDCRILPPEDQILSLNINEFNTYCHISPNESVDQEFLAYLETAFRSLSCLNGSFLLDNDKHYYCTSKHHGIDLKKAEELYSFLGRVEHESIKNVIWSCITEELLKQLVSSPPDVEALRIYVTLPIYHEFNNPKQYQLLHSPFANALLKLKQQASRVVGLWWSNTLQEYFEHLVYKFKSVVIYIISHQQILENQTITSDPHLKAMLDILSLLNKLNHSVEGLKVPYDTFHIIELSDYLDVRVDYVSWLMESNGNKLFLCNYPFLFDAQAKTSLLQTDQTIQMQNAMSNAAQRALMAMLFSPSSLHTITQFLELNVTRENIVADALRELSSVSSNDLKKPLKVRFCGEEAEDAGGVRKEFFMLLLKEILDPKFGMFKEYEETRTIWFSEDSFEEEVMYFLIGIICGLAIYNYTIINMPFPLALYKKLLNEPIILTDMKGLSPTIANSLQSLLDYNEDDIEDVFNLSFEITRDKFGEMQVIPLKPNGENVNVTQENKQEYVSLYVDYVFNKSVEKHYKAFSQGFMKVCGGRVLELFHSHELMAVVIGNENYDWEALEDAAEYKNGYSSSDPTIRWFWEVLHELSLEDKKKFLLFLTGCDRIPIQGMKAIKIVIQPTNDDKFLPVAHTCFNLLDLPRYQTKEKLKYKLLQAIQQTQGFSLV